MVFHHLQHSVKPKSQFLYKTKFVLKTKPGCKTQYSQLCPESKINKTHIREKWILGKRSIDFHYIKLPNKIFLGTITFFWYLLSSGVAAMDSLLFLTVVSDRKFSMRAPPYPQWTLIYPLCLNLRMFYHPLSRK